MASCSGSSRGMRTGNSGWARWLKRRSSGSRTWYQASNLSSAAGIFAVTFAGGMLFGWLFIRWNYNLWLPIVLHMLMNAYWSIFGMGANALGGTWGNVFRAASVVLAVVVTLKVAGSGAPQRRPAVSG